LERFEICWFILFFRGYFATEENEEKRGAREKLKKEKREK